MASRVRRVGRLIVRGSSIIIPNVGLIRIDAHDWAIAPWAGHSQSSNFERFHLWVACALERPPYLEVGCEVPVHWVPLDDRGIDLQNDLSDIEMIRRARLAAKLVESTLQVSEQVLVTCHMGLNRSALVAGLALRRLGLEADEVVEAIRAARGPDALGNLSFRAIVEDGLLGGL